MREPKIAELSLNKANGESGSVKVTVKSTGVSYKPKEKKTGALSPRAPEKIKKNRAEEMKVYGENACLELFCRASGEHCSRMGNGANGTSNWRDFSVI